MNAETTTKATISMKDPETGEVIEGDLDELLRTEQDRILTVITGAVKTTGQDLTRRAVESMVATGQREASLSVSVKFTPHKEFEDKIVTQVGGKLTTAAVTRGGTFSLDDVQGLLPIDPEDVDA